MFRIYDLRYLKIYLLFEYSDFTPFIFYFIELFDDQDDISGMKLYEKPDTYKKGAMLEKAKSFKLSQNIHPIINLEKVSPCKTPTKKKKGSYKIINLIVDFQF